MRQIKLVALGIGLLLTMASMTAGQSPVLVDVNYAGTDVANSTIDQGTGRISSDGRFVVFTSSASDLVANDTNGNDDVFVRDLVANKTILVSINSAGTDSSNGSSREGTISADGRFVAFSSSGTNLLPTSVQYSKRQIFLRDLVTGAITLMSVSHMGQPANRYCDGPRISADGQFVLFMSPANNLVSLIDYNEPNQDPFDYRNHDVFVRDIAAGVTKLVSVNVAGTGTGEYESWYEEKAKGISSHGRFITFRSYSSDLAPNDFDGERDTFIRDMVTGSTMLYQDFLNDDDYTVPANSSPDERYVFYYSDTDPSDDFYGDVFIKDMVTHTRTMITVNRFGTGGANGNSFYFSMSDDGRFISFASEASNLVDLDTNGHITDVFVRDMTTGTTTLVSRNVAGTGSSNNYGAQSPQISNDGQYLTFISNSSNLVPSDPHNGIYGWDVFIYDRVSGKIEIVNIDSSLYCGDVAYPLISGNGQTVLFESCAHLLAVKVLRPVSDYDGDKVTDSVVWRPGNRTFYYTKSSTETNMSKPWGASTDRPVPADYDGDRITDFAVWRPSTATFIILKSSDGLRLDQQLGVDTDKPVPADYDGDGKTDVAVYRPGDGTWLILQSSTNTLRTKQLGGLSTDCPIPADYDGDRKADLAVYRANAMNWIILRSSTNTQTGKNWGLNGATPVPADYDGDGKADLAAFEPVVGRWRILKSSDNTTIAPIWGSASDTPQPGDYDRDGKADLAVWTPSTGIWNILSSSNGQVIQRTLGVSGDIPVTALNIVE